MAFVTQPKKLSSFLDFSRVYNRLQMCLDIMLWRKWLMLHVAWEPINLLPAEQAWARTTRTRSLSSRNVDLTTNGSKQRTSWLRKIGLGFCLAFAFVTRSWTTMARRDERHQMEHAPGPCGNILVVRYIRFREFNQLFLPPFPPFPPSFPAWFPFSFRLPNTHSFCVFNLLYIYSILRMVAFTKSFFPLLVATLLATYVDAVPWPSYAKHSTHRRRTIGKRAVNIESFHPKNTFKVIILNVYNIALCLISIINLRRLTAPMDLQFLLEIHWLRHLWKILRSLSLERLGSMRTILFTNLGSPMEAPAMHTSNKPSFVLVILKIVKLLIFLDRTVFPSPMVLEMLPSMVTRLSPLAHLSLTRNPVRYHHFLMMNSAEK